jgi:uncharacterized membrane protein YkoI
MRAVTRWSLLSVIAVAGSLIVTSTRVVGAQQVVKRDLPDSLLKVAKVGEHAARLTAQAKVPHARVEAVELEREDGHLQYSYDMKVPGQAGTTEVNVDAVTGAVLGVHHEGALDEAKEGAAEAKK